MRSSLVAIGSVLLAASLVVASPVDAGIDEAYTKPDGEETWGELLAEFVGHRGFSKSYALVVGISAFEYYPALPTVKDPLRMRDFLINEAGFDYVHVLTDDKATKTRIDELMIDILPSMIDDNDRFLFYWSGHGDQRPNAVGGDVGYLPLAGSRVSSYSTMVGMGDIQRWDALLEAQQALFLLDACFSGLAGVNSQSGGDNLRDLQIDQLAKPAHHLITAGAGGEQTIAGDRWGGSIFTDAVLRAIRGEADAATSFQRDGVVSLSELIGYVKTRVAMESRTAGWTKAITPQSRDLRTNVGEFFFVTNERKVAKRESEGAKYQGRFEHGMFVVVMGAVEGPTTASSSDPYVGRDAAVFAVIKDSTIANDFEDFLAQFPESVFASYARNRLALLAQTPQSRAVGLGPAALEASLNLRPEDRTVIQQALTALGFDTRGIDGVFVSDSKTNRLIIAWPTVA